MKNKNVEFFLIKLLILAIVDALLVALYFVLGVVLRVVGVNELVGEASAKTIQFGIIFILFLLYSFSRAYKFKIHGDGSDDPIGLFAVKEGAVYAAFMLPLLIISMICGGGVLPAYLEAIYSPHLLMTYVSSSAVVGFGVPVLVYTAGVTSMRIIALNQYKPQVETTEAVEE